MNTSDYSNPKDQEKKPQFVSSKEMDELNGRIDEKLKKRMEEKKVELENAKSSNQNKEPFTSIKFFELRGKTSQYGTNSHEPTDDEIFILEYKYFVEHPELKTIEEYVNLLEELDVYDVG